MPERLSLDLYDVFVAIAEAKSLTAAATRLRTTKATVSRSLAKLEELLGTELVHRSTRSMSLSAAGAALYDRIAGSIAVLRDASVELPSKKDVPRGTLRVTAPNDLAISLLPDILAICAARYPAVHVEAHVTNDVVKLIADGFDAALRIATAPPGDSGLTARKLAVVAMGAYASPAYLSRRGTPSRIGDEAHDWVVHTSARKALKTSARPRLVTNDMLLLRAMAARGMGVGVIAQFVASPSVVSGELVRVLPEHALRQGTLSLVYPSSGQVPRKLEVFRDAVLEALRARPLPES